MSAERGVPLRMSEFVYGGAIGVEHHAWSEYEVTTLGMEPTHRAFSAAEAAALVDVAEAARGVRGALECTNALRDALDRLDEARR